MKIGSHRVTLIEVLIVAFIVLGVVVVIVASKQQAEAKARWMRQCMEDHKQYECEIMWKQAQPDTKFIYIPSN